MQAAVKYSRVSKKSDGETPEENVLELVGILKLGVLAPIGIDGRRLMMPFR
jgi:hypothetical protein